MINQVILIGRLTKDVEVQKTNSGKSVASFSLAVDSYYGNGQKTCSFIPCTAWGVVAENLSRFCRKGSQIAIEGRLQQRSYQGKDGNRYVVEVVCTTIEFLERRGGDSKGSTYENMEGVPAQVADDFSEDTLGLDNDTNDLPF